MLKKAEESSVFARSWHGCLLTRLSVCVRFRCVCVRFRCVCVRFRCVCLRALQCAENFSHSARLQQSRAFYMLASCFRAVLILSPDTWDWTRMHTLMVMHRRTLYENVDSAKIKVPFYTTDIDILCVALMHRIVIHCIDKSMNRYTPTHDTWTILPMLLLCVCVLIVVIHLLSTQGQRIKNILICVL